MNPLKNYYTPVRKTSEIASKDYKNNSLDFVFIDGDHSYDGVFNDITNWFPKIKIGGIISGHDYWPGTNNWIEFFKAVNDYFINKKEVVNFGNGVWMVHV
jgi:hypothetical protein